MSELRTLECGGRTISYELERKRVKNVNLRIKSDGTVRISAGSRVPIKFIEDFIREKSDFIFKALDKYERRSAVPELPESGKTYKSGDKLCFFGRICTLETELTPSEYVRHDENIISVGVKSEDRAGKLLEKFYSEETRKLFETYNRRTVLMFRARGYNVPEAVLQVRDMRSQWGSCHISDKKVVISSRLALYPEVCAAYVFVHEYAHFIVPDHSARFYDVVRSVMPDYKICADILKK